MAEHIILWDGPVWQDLLPFTYTRPAGLIRTGILTTAEKYERFFEESVVSHLTNPYLRVKYEPKPGKDNLVLNASILPDQAFIDALGKLKTGESLWQKDIFLGARMSEDAVGSMAETGNLPQSQYLFHDHEISFIDRIWKIFLLCNQEIRKDFELLTEGKKSKEISKTNIALSPENIFIEEGAIVEGACLNASAGPIYIGKDSEVMEGSLVRGPFSLGDHSVLKLGAKIYGATSIGPECKVGGEVNNAVFFGRTNKAHDGFVGNAVIGEWCNIGADSNNSNLKNNYEEVKVWSYRSKGFVRTGQQFCGLFMADHAKCGINTMFNTGTVVGVSANVFGGGFPRNFIPSFSWGGASGFTTYQLSKALDTAEKVMVRRNIVLSKEDRQILESVFTLSQEFRNF